MHYGQNKKKDDITNGLLQAGKKESRAVKCQQKLCVIYANCESNAQIITQITVK